jgi:6-pyruvoyltetrahydropterin/6-carboxytetrahydropterin synthase
MIVELRKEFRFEAAHFLPRVPPGHKCSRMHGHSYRIELTLAGAVDPSTGWLIDFAAIDDVWAELHARLDHRTLNDVPGLENSTCENLANYLFAEIRPKLTSLTAVTVWETPDASCTFRGPAT